MVPHVFFSFLCYPILEPYTSSSSDTWQIAHKSPSVKKIDQNRANCLLLPDWRFFWILLNIMFFNVTLITPHSTNRFPHQLAFFKGWQNMGTYGHLIRFVAFRFFRVLPGLPPRVRTRKPSDDYTWHCARPPCHHQYPPPSSGPGVQPKVEEQFL